MASVGLLREWNAQILEQAAIVGLYVQNGAQIWLYLHADFLKWPLLLNEICSIA